MLGGAGAPATADRKVYRGSSLLVVASDATADSCVPSNVVMTGWVELLVVVVTGGDVVVEGTTCSSVVV